MLSTDYADFTEPEETVSRSSRQEQPEDDEGALVRLLLLPAAPAPVLKICVICGYRLESLADPNRQGVTRSANSKIDAVIDVILFVEREPQTCARCRQ